MASSSINPSTKSDNNNNKNQLSETFNESDKNLSTSSSNVEETINEPGVKIVRGHPIAVSNSLLSHEPLARPKRSTVNYARPYEEVLVGQPGTDVSSGISTKSNEKKSSFTTKPS
ncbi:unnamed protein product [Rotaria sordida]|uniref:Uncharacterized protein n=1 Tax=Rotaria sordida TaxID=392033 RepID=A0A814ZXL1_9BILA|nr:unnamed protein product [Rotaria sordida]CAF1248354.1 unnamed protein product [Rotaria sordida]CAF1529747.1 unnamed protein product [Rotaria sordida]CAF1529875.1 unnamed protein product [Rotaria sordida]